MPDPSPSTPAPSRLRVVHPVLPVLLTVLCLGLAVQLVPSKDELVKRMIQDRSHVRGMETAMNLNAVETVSAPAIDGPAAVQALTEALAQPALLNQLINDEAGRAQLAEGVLRSPAPASSLEDLTAQAAALPIAAQEKLLQGIANRAKALDQPKLAAMIFTRWMQLRPEELSQETVEMLVRNYRAESQATEATNFLKVWIAHAIATGQEIPEHLEDIYVHLLFEVNQAGAALDILLVKLADQQAHQGKVSAGLLAAAIEAGNYSGRVLDLRPYLASSVAVLPLGQASLSEICAAVSAGRSPLLQGQEQWSKSALELAHWNEWADPPTPDCVEQALALYEKLAVLGTPGCLDKVIDMATDLQSTGNLLKILDVVMHLPRPPAEQELVYGHALGVAGRLAEADGYYRIWLQAHPQDLPARAEYAALLHERGELPEALAAWKEAADTAQQRQWAHGRYWLARHRWDCHADLPIPALDFRKRQAELHVELQQNSEALAIYRELLPSQHDNNTLESMALLAESLGDFPLLTKAMELRFHKLAHPSVHDYLVLARSYDLTGQDDQYLEILRQGLVQQPQSLNLRRQYASALQDSEQLGNAVDLLEVASTLTDLRSMCIYIVAASQSAQYERAAGFLKDQIGRRRDFPDDVKLHLGRICHYTGQFDVARGYFTSVESNAATWPLLAEACFQTGAVLEAEKYQRRYLDGLADTPADQLTFLGDICTQLGKSTEAALAYDQALEAIRSKHNSEIPPAVIPKVSTSFNETH